jgi:hypothetical protein
MESMRSTWTDSRLDDLNGRVDELGHRMDAGFARVDSHIRELRGEVGALNRTIIQVGSGMAGTVLVGFLGLIATQI